MDNRIDAVYARQQVVDGLISRISAASQNVEIAYAVSKVAMIGLCKQASVALTSKNIRVNCVNPEPNDTGYMTGEEYKSVVKMFPAGRWDTPADVADLLLFCTAGMPNGLQVR